MRSFGHEDLNVVRRRYGHRILIFENNCLLAPNSKFRLLISARFSTYHLDLSVSIIDNYSSPFKCYQSQSSISTATPLAHAEEEDP